jgi:hypothetical protein
VSSNNPLAELAATLIRRFDGDADGKLSSGEFGDLLKGALAESRTNSTFSAGTAATAAAAMASTAAAGANPTMEGFDPTKLANTNHKTLKYDVGRVLSQYPNTPQGLQDALPALQALVPGVRITGSSGDKLDFGTYAFDGHRIGVIDVLRGASTGGAAWQWAPVE